ncbi:MAG: hypothetical protein JWP12_2589 [Bacteroidetes bacterium]|nr:hypothetical protein [Bacteroidota bacterium]
MKLLQVKILDFKSIKNLTVQFKNNLTCLIGKNESGKSSIIEAIEYLNYYKLFGNNFKLKNKNSPQYNKEFPVIIGDFKGSAQEIGKKKTEEFIRFYTIDIKTILQEIITSEDFYYTIIRWGDGTDHIEVKIYNKEHLVDVDIFQNLKDERSKNAVIEFFVENFVPAIELFSDENLEIKPAKIEDLKGDKQEFETLRRLLIIGGCEDFSVLESDDDHLVGQILGTAQDKITRLFQKHYNQDDSIRFELTYLRNKIVLQIYDASDARYSIEERSPGFRYYFAFLINKYYLTKDSLKPLVFLLDEPGASLYPHACKSLLKTFDEFSLKNEIIYTTHNVFLTLRNDLDSLVFTTKDKNKGTLIERKTYKNKYQIFRKELGILLNDSFLIGNLNIIVEGDTEHFVLRKLISEYASKDEKYASLEWLNIYDAGGVSEIENAIRYLNSLGDELCGVILLDSDEAGDKVFKKEKFAKLIDNKRWFCIRINDVFQDSKSRTFEDLLPQNEYIRAYNSHYSEGSYDFDKPFSKLEEKELNTPIVDSIEESHYLEFFEIKNRKKKGISKINIMRVLLENVKKNGEGERNAVLENVNKLIELINDKVKKIKNVDTKA